MDYTDLNASLGMLNSSLMNASNVVFAAQTKKQDRNFTREMHELQRKEALEDWNRMVEYNSPSAALSRLKDAGLNPLLMYGEGGQALQAAPSVNQAQTQNFRSESPKFDVNAQLSLGLMQLQAEKLRAEIGLLDSESRNKDADTSLKGSQKESFDISNYFDKSTMQLRQDALRYENDLKVSMRNVNVATMNQIEEQCKLFNKEIEKIDADIANQKDLTEAQCFEIFSRVQQAWERLPHEIAKLDADSRAALANAWYTGVLADFQKRLGTDSYVANLQNKAAQEFYNAVVDGDTKQMELLYQRWLGESSPKPGSAAFKYRTWLQNWVLPTTSAIGPILGGAAGAALFRAIPTKKGRPVGFTAPQYQKNYSPKKIGF